MILRKYWVECKIFFLFWNSIEKIVWFEIVLKNKCFEIILKKKKFISRTISHATYIKIHFCYTDGLYFFSAIEIVYSTRRKLVYNLFEYVSIVFAYNKGKN